MASFFRKAWSRFSSKDAVSTDAAPEPITPYKEPELTFPKIDEPVVIEQKGPKINPPFDWLDVVYDKLHEEAKTKSLSLEKETRVQGCPRIILFKNGRKVLPEKRLSARLKRSDGVYIVECSNRDRRIQHDLNELLYGSDVIDGFELTFWGFSQVGPSRVSHRLSKTTFRLNTLTRTWEEA